MSWIEQTDEFFRSLRLWDLKLDEAYLNFTLPAEANEIFLYGLAAECDKCPFTKLAKVTSNASVVTIDTAERMEFKIFTGNRGKYVFDNVTDFVCHEKPSLGEFGVYDVNVREDGCSFETALEPVKPVLSLIVVTLIIIAFAFLYKLSIKGYRLLSTPDESSRDTELNLTAPQKPRLKSLDTFRGIAIVIMIFVNSGGGGFRWIEHATWNGLHIADLVFPWFIWIMGACIPMSVRSALNRNVSRTGIFLNVLRRSVTLFCIGVCLNSINGPLLQDLRFFGVLQRFGVAYLVVTGLQAVFMNPTPVQPQNPVKRALFDVFLLTPQYLVSAGIVIFYLCLVFFLPVPGCERGYFGPGGKHDYFSNPACIGGVTGYIDRLVLGLSHIYQHPTAKKVFESSAFDPEGVFGCLPTIIQTIFGAQAGMILLYHAEAAARLKRWLSWGLILGLISGILCGFSKNDGVIPINKNLWSLSFVLATSGLAFFLLAACFYLIDVKKWWTDEWNPFLYPGQNAIIMYVGHTIMHKMLPWHWRVTYMNTHFIRLLENSWNTVLWVLIAIYLYNKNIFYSV
ncbi:heparan-alpha-glucosaminide N-acetyltransferase [Culicoides brevitarsis]|uniref:heparan-alpha-glucosaminide N-acetyltransferase n=1 Tax=Culicoides brevitarsis TaxID=469753 RepID=UPI00307B88AB